MIRILFLLFSMMLINGCRADYDVIIRNGKIVDGSGSAGYTADIGISNGKIVMIEEHISEPGALEIDARGQVVCPGFIDILSWACGPVLYDSEVRSVVQQGITTTVFGEGWSMGPVISVIWKPRPDCTLTSRLLMPEFPPRIRYST